MAATSVNPIGHLRDIDWWEPSVIALVLANLVPAFGVLFLHWEVFPLMFLFWSENVVVGGFNVLKMLANQPTSPVMWIGKLFLIPMFTYGHGVFVMGLFGGSLNHMHGFPKIADFWAVIGEYGLGWAILGLAVSHGVSFVTNYIGKGEYQRVGLQQLMNQPYGRIIVLHLAILFGGFLVMALHSPTPALLLLVALKTAFDLGSHVGERKKFASVSSTVESVAGQTTAA